MYPSESTPVLQPGGGDLTCNRKKSLESKELLNRREASEYSSLIGTAVAVATYAKLACLGGGYWLVYRSSKAACADGEACARPLPNRMVKIGLILGTILVVVALGFDFLAPLLLNS